MSRDLEIWTTILGSTGGLKLPVQPKKLLRKPVLAQGSGTNARLFAS